MQKVVPTYKQTYSHMDMVVSASVAVALPGWGGGGSILTFIYHCCNSAMLSSEGLNIDLLHKIIEIQERK